ncbi:hypothetical protein PHLGIDRAFT_270082 [Phlebiopsis gigantea 11061_1 CR5-6]|uniref:Uncharacterized protein n=1 Tax=Phlebiopsis gigantea (strain 11061_1 CR5-6) TaxID=745531 RepID=A0A0C3S4H2_PHLG1|nr:hypothetical protein PHLGIDRAFT_270082 [Phlebiopsis gigantea 11061_1 CR5-6]
MVRTFRLHTPSCFRPSAIPTHDPSPSGRVPPHVHPPREISDCPGAGRPHPASFCTHRYVLSRHTTSAALEEEPLPSGQLSAARQPSCGSVGGSDGLAATRARTARWASISCTKNGADLAVIQKTGANGPRSPHLSLRATNRPPHGLEACNGSPLLCGTRVRHVREPPVETRPAKVEAFHPRRRAHRLVNALVPNKPSGSMIGRCRSAIPRVQV